MDNNNIIDSGIINITAELSSTVNENDSQLKKVAKRKAGTTPAPCNSGHPK